MLTSLQALLRLAVLQRLGVFICALATLLAAASTASALEPAQTKTRVWGFDFAADNSVGLFRAATPRTHLENRSAGAEAASGSLLAARGAGELLANANRVFRNGPLTAAGRALTKHPNIIGESGNLFQKLGGAANVNAAAEGAIQNILRNGAMVTKDTKAFGSVIEYTLENGLGARWSAETREFIGFLGRGL